MDSLRCRDGWRARVGGKAGPGRWYRLFQLGGTGHEQPNAVPDRHPARLWHQGSHLGARSSRLFPVLRARTFLLGLEPTHVDLTEVDSPRRTGQTVHDRIRSDLIRQGVKPRV